jgi:hypothetical protein
MKNCLWFLFLVQQPAIEKKLGSIMAFKITFVLNHGVIVTDKMIKFQTFFGFILGKN